MFTGEGEESLNHHALVGACERELLPEEMGFSPAWAWSDSTTESDLEPRDRMEGLWLSAPG